MITSGNVEIDAAFAELQRQLTYLSGECAALAGKLAVAEAKLRLKAQEAGSVVP